MKRLKLEKTAGFFLGGAIVGSVSYAREMIRLTGSSSLEELNRQGIPFFG